MLSNLVVIYDHSQKSSRPLFGASFQRCSRRRKGEVKVSIERLSHKSPWTPLLASQVVMAVELQQAKVGAFGRRLRPVPVNLPLGNGCQIAVPVVKMQEAGARSSSTPFSLDGASGEAGSCVTVKGLRSSGLPCRHAPALCGCGVSYHRGDPHERHVE